MKVFLSSLLVLSVYHTHPQNIGFGTNEPKTIIDINGDLALRSTSLFLNNGIQNSVDVSAKFSNFIITGPTAPFIVAGLTPGSEGKLLTLFNRSGQLMTLIHEAETADYNARILTGNDLPLAIPNNASIQLQYVQNVARWVVRSNSAPGPWLVNSDRLYTLHAGNVGIGTLFPAYRFEVKGNGYFQGNNPYLAIEAIPQGNFMNYGGLQVASPNTDNYPAGIEQNIVAINGNQIQSYVKNIDDPFVSDYTRPLAINPMGGAVGIGTNYALGYAKLEVLTEPESRALSLGDGTVGMVHFLGGGNRGLNGLGGYFGTSTNHPLHFYTNSQFAQMSLLPNGALCIGTLRAATGYKLNVAGKVMAEELRIQSLGAWPDYVFQKGYHLKSLSELEAEINRLGHLPGIPDAETVQNEGIMVGDMQARMLEKMEELTLYIIDLEKKVRQLSLKNRRNSLGKTK